MGTPNLTRLGLGDQGPIVPERAMRGRGRGARWVEWLLMTAGILLLGYFLYGYGEARLYQSVEDRELDQILNSVTPAAATSPLAPAPQRTIPVGTTVGRIEIPRLGVSAVIRAGTDARTLRLAVGYIPGTGLPGEPGNVGLAAHRDTFFRQLRDINPDDEIRLVTKDGVYRYHVERTSIVMPKDVWVLDPTNYPALTLVTCYPFNYIGSAPKRFVVRAALQAPETPAPSVGAKTAATTAALESKPSIVRTAIATRKLTPRSAVSTHVHRKATHRPKRSLTHGRLVSAKTTARAPISKRARTTTKIRATN